LLPNSIPPILPFLPPDSVHASLATPAAAPGYLASAHTAAEAALQALALLQELAL
jgi:hypothetical protein